MRINNKRYNPDTAREIDSFLAHDCFGNPYPVTDFRYESWTLYKKRTGEYFLFAKGGALSPFCHTCKDGSRCAGECIAPLTEKQARVWKILQWDELDWY